MLAPPLWQRSTREMAPPSGDRLPAEARALVDEAALGRGQLEGPQEVGHLWVTWRHVAS